MQALLKTISEIGSEKVADMLNGTIVNSLQNMLKDATRNGDLETVVELLKMPCIDPNDGDIKALAWAITHGHAKIAETLLGDPRVTELESGFLMACSCNNWKMAEILVADPRLVITDKLFRRVVGNYSYRYTKLLMSTGKIDPSADNNAALRIAIDRGELLRIGYLLEDKRVDPFADNCQLVFYALTHNRETVVEMMVAAPQFDPAKHAATMLSWPNLPEKIRKMINDKLPAPGQVATVGFTVNSAAKITIDYDARKYSVEQV